MDLPYVHLFLKKPVEVVLPVQGGIHYRRTQGSNRDLVEKGAGTSRKGDGSPRTTEAKGTRPEAKGFGLKGWHHRDSAS